MMTKKRLPLLTIATVLFGLVLPAAAAGPSGPAPAPVPPRGHVAGSITALLPVAHIIRGVGRRAVSSTAKRGDEIIWNDLIRTDRGGRARITLSDQSILSLGSQADLRVVRHNARTQETRLEMTYGRVRAEVARVTRMGGSFELRTPTAVAGVIGTDFGVDSTAVGGSTFICISGLVQISNSDPNIAGSVQCAPGMTTTVTAGKAPTPPANATPQQIQQLIQDTEPAIITAMAPMSALPGATIDATLNGTKMANVKTASVTPADGISLSLTGTSDTSATVHMVIAANAAPGPRTIHLSKESGADSAAVFTILSPPTGSAADLKKPYLDLMTQEGQTAAAGLGAYLSALQQTRDQALQQLQASNGGNVSLNDATQQFDAEIASVQNAINTATQQITADVTQAGTNFQTQFDAAHQALLQRNSDGTADDSFNQAVKTAFDTANAALGQQFKAIHDSLESSVSSANTNIASAQQTWMTTITQAAGKPCDPGQICPVVNTTERSVDVGAAIGGGGVAALDASSSRASNGGSIVAYQWVLCDPSYKPAQSGVPLAANATAGCAALPGYQSSSSEFQFPTCNLQPNDYVARVTITDSNNKSAAMDVKLHILAGTYDDPATVVRNLAQAYGTLQVTSFLNFFDQTAFSGFTALSENIRNTFPTLASMSINPRVSQAAITCNDATVRADWVQNYTYKTNPSVTFSQSEQLSMRMTRMPGKGWLITDFQGDNGTVQGQLPGPAVTIAPQPDLQITNTDVFAGATTPQTAVAAGQQVFSATVHNIGAADFTANTVVHFELDNAQGAAVGQADAPLPVPLAAGGSVTVQATITVPALTPNSQLTIKATVNPPGTGESRTDNNLGSANVIMGGGDLQLVSAYMTSLGAPTASPIPVAAGTYNFTAVVKNGGTSQFVGPTLVQFTLSSGSTVVATAQASPNVGTLNPGDTTTVTGSINVPNSPNTSLTFTADVNPGCTAAETACGAENQFTQTLAVQPLIVQANTVNIQAASPAIASALTVNVFRAATLTLTLPAGITADKPLTQTLTAGGSFTWNLGADFTAQNGQTMQVVADAGVPVTLPVKYSVLPPVFTQTATPSLTAQGAAGTLSVSVNVPGTYTLTPPTGISIVLPAGPTTNPVAQTITSPTGGTLSWDIQSDFSAAAGTALTAVITAGNYSYAAVYNNAGEANYVITSATFVGHTAPFTGANALQVGESASLEAVVQNVGNTSPSGTITLTATCSPLNTADTTSCQGGNNPTGTVAAPAAGQSVTVTMPLGGNNNMIPGHFNGTVTLATPITQTSTADDSLVIPFDVVDFYVTVQNALNPQYLLPNSSQNFTVSVQVVGTTPFAVPVALSFDSSGTGGAGISFSPGTANVSGAQTFSVSAAGSAPAGGAFAVLATGTNRGVSRPAGQAFIVLSNQLVFTNLFVNDSSNPLLIPVGSTSAQQIPMQLSGTGFAGAATIVLPTLTGFSINTDATAGVPYGSTFNVNVTANSASTAAVPLTVTAELPNTNPVLSISKTIYVQGTGQPDLAVVSVTPNTTLSTSTPWIDGQSVDFSVGVQNVGNAPTAGGEKVTIELNGVPVGSASMASTPMSPGVIQTVVVHAIAPDIHGNTPYGPTLVSGRAHIEAEQAGEPNYTNNSMTFSEPMANWHIDASGAGSQSTPLSIILGSTGGSGIVTIAGTVDGGASFSSYSSLNFNPGPGQASATFSVLNIGNTLTDCGTTPPVNTMFCATVSTANTSLQAGLYFAQVLVTLTDSTTGQQTAVRQATVAVQVGTGSPTAATCLTSSANNVVSYSANTPSATTCASTIGSGTLQLNGGLSEQLSITPTMYCGGLTAPTVCSGQVDLAIHDDPNTTTTPVGSTSGIATGSPVVLRVAANMDANGNVTVGSASSYVIGINGVQQPLAKRGSAASPDAIGTQVALRVQVGDISVSASGVSSANGAFCGGVAPGGTGLPVAITLNSLGGFNASYTWQWEDTNHSPVGVSPFSFSVPSGGATGSIGETVQFTGASPINALTRYFLAITISNGTATATKYFPFFFDGSTSQNYCGAISGVRGGASIQGTWSRSAADMLGPVSGTGVATNSARTAPTVGAVDVHLVASDISFTPSIPKPGDTLLVRFRATNSGSADGNGIPIALQVNGVTVAKDTFDIPAGHSALGGLSWTVTSDAGAASVAPRVSARNRKIVDAGLSEPDSAAYGMAALRAVLVVDPQHLTQQATTQDKSAMLAHLNVRSPDAEAAAAATPGQRILLELEDGACAGLHVAGESIMPCGTDDLEITVADLAKSQLGLDAMGGVSDLGTTFEAANAAARKPSYDAQTPGMAGHVYELRLPTGGTATVTIDSIRNPNELDAKARALFRASAARILRNLGGSSGAAAPGDLTGVQDRATVFVTLTIRRN